MIDIGACINNATKWLISSRFIYEIVSNTVVVALIITTLILLIIIWCFTDMEKNIGKKRKVRYILRIALVVFLAIIPLLYLHHVSLRYEFKKQTDDFNINLNVNSVNDDNGQKFPVQIGAGERYRRIEPLRDHDDRHRHHHSIHSAATHLTGGSYESSEKGSQSYRSSEGETEYTEDRTNDSRSEYSGGGSDYSKSGSSRSDKKSRRSLKSVHLRKY